jgi:ATP-binding cassette, subfamily C, bacteriocin exporter
MITPYACVRQTDITDCGAACLATVARVHGLRIPIALIRQYAGTDRLGTNVLGLVEAAQRLGFHARGVRGSVEALAQVPLPCIAHVDQAGLLHYVTILRVTARTVTVADPARGIVRHPLSRFGAIWSGVLVLLVPSPAFQRGSVCSGRRRGLMILFRQNRLLLFETLLATVFLTVLGLATSLYLRVILDRVLVTGDQLLFRWLSAGLVVLALIRAAFGAVRGTLSAYVSRAVDLSLMLTYYRRVLSMPLQFFETRASGEILSRLGDAVKVRTMICGSTLTLLVDAATIAAGFTVLLCFNCRLALSVLPVVPVMASVLHVAGRPLRRAQRSALELAAELQSRLVESIAGIATIKAFRTEQKEGQKAEGALVCLLRETFGATLWGVASGSAGEILTSLALVGLLWNAGWMVLAGKLTLGQLVACYSVLLYMLQPLSRLADLNQQIQDAWVAAERLYEILELQPESAANQGKPVLATDLTGRIDFEQVAFRYGTREPVLREITLSVRPHSLLALVGESGSGKSTLARLLVRFHDPQAGQIKIGGHDLRDFDLASLRSHIGYVDQDAFLFSGTIEENLMLGDRRDNTDAAVRAIRAVGLEDFVSRLPQRLGTRVGERGLTLSSGQRQRLAIARALVSDPPVLVLDEATCHLDPDTERQILKLLQSLKQHKTIILIGHRLALARHADRIAVLRAGRILEQGTHQELLDARGPYWLLWQSGTVGPGEIADTMDHGFALTI